MIKLTETQKAKYRNSLFWKNTLWSVARWILLIGIMYVLIYPLLFSFATSIKSTADMLDPTSIWVAKHPTLSNYVDAFKKIGYMQGFKNTLTIAVPASIMQVLTCSFVAYGFARFKFAEKGLLFALVLFTLVVPAQTIAVPQYLMFKDLGMLDTYSPFLLPTLFGLGLKGGLFIYIFRQFFRGLPKELEDAAYIDGCGAFKTYFTVMLPNAKPAILTVFLFSFVWHWNDIFGPTIFLQKGTLTTLAMKLTNITTYLMGDREVGEMIDSTTVLPSKNAGILLVILPVLILYGIAQKQFIEGVERSGIVG